jgi:predicted secreted hydrolase
MKYIISLLLCLLLFFGPLPTFFAGSAELKDDSGFTPQDMVLCDDAFHGREDLPFTEWWYFDAMFENNYSVQMSVRIISMLGKGVVFERLDIYRNNMIITDQTRTFPLRELSASLDVPSVQIQGETIFSGTQNPTTGNFEYTVSFVFPSYAAQLHFVGCTQGWKGQHKSGDWWAVALPRAEVSGSIIVDNETISVTGTGYHDHNWDVTPKSVLRFGWFWGKFNSEEYTVTWSVLLPNKMMKKPILVVNEKNASYFAVPPKEIWFSVGDIHRNHLMRVPYFFHVGTMIDSVLLIADMEVIQADYKHIMGTMHYWRFHIRCYGTIFADGHAETIDDVFIAEYIRFR